MVEVSESGEKPLNRRQQSKIRTREGVLVAGRELFMEGGYANATIRDIAKRIPRGPDKPRGMSTGAVFANFDSKADLLLAVVEEELQFHKELLDRTASEDGTMLERIVKICTSDFVFFKDRLNLMEALATLETLVEPEKKDSLATSRRALCLTGQRRSRVREAIWLRLENARCGSTPYIVALTAVMVSAHCDRCRGAAVAGWEANEYRNTLTADFRFLISPDDLNLVA